MAQKRSSGLMIRSVTFRENRGLYRPVPIMAFSPNSEFLAVGSGNRVHVYHFESAKLLSRLYSEENKEKVVHLAFDNDGGLMVCWQYGHIGKYFDGQLRDTRQVAEASIACAVLSSSCKTIALQKEGCPSIEIRGLLGGEIRSKIEVAMGEVKRMAFAGDHLAVLWSTGEISLYHTDSGKQVWHKNAHACCMAPLPDGNYIVVGREDNTISLIETPTGKTRATSIPWEWRIVDVVCSSAGIIASLDSAGAIMLWNQQAIAIDVIGIRKRAASIAISPDGKRIAVCSTDDWVSLYHISKRDGVL